MHNKSFEYIMCAGQNESTKKVTLSVAILSEEPLGWGSGKHYFPMILDDYQWMKKGKTYQIKTTFVTDKDVLKGLLTKKKFDVLLVPGGGVGDGEAVVKGFTFLPKVKKWKQQIISFIKQGGGYIGICGGTALATELITASGTHETLMEKLYQKSAIGFTHIKSYYKDLALPMFCLSQYNHPEKIGAMGYIFSFSPGQTKNNMRLHTGGVPLDFIINKKHPIFSDVSQETIRIRWWGGPGLVVPQHSKSNIDVIASYPDTDLSENPSTAITAWQYTGNLFGLIKGFFRSFHIIKNESDTLRNLFLYTYFLAGPWKKSHTKINMDLKGKPSIATEIYPNENQARIILCTSHPEYMIWWDGAITEAPQNMVKCLADGLHQWKEIDNLSEDLIDEFTYTWWVVRRFVAWAAKVPDDALPPREKGKKTDEVKNVLSRNVFWDGSITDNMKNI